MNTKRVSDEEKYHFDTLGFLLIKNVLDDSEIEKLKKTFIKVKNNNDYNSINLNKKEMIPDDVNHASRVFIDDHYVRLNHLDKLDDNFSFLINHQKYIIILSVLLINLNLIFLGEYQIHLEIISVVGIQDINQVNIDL